MSKQFIGAQANSELIAQVDEIAKRLEINRSTFIRRAIELLIAMETITEQ